MADGYKLITEILISKRIKAILTGKRRTMMSGIMIIAVGICLIVLSVILFAASLFYRRTAGNRIQERLIEEYGK